VIRKLRGTIAATLSLVTYLAAPVDAAQTVASGTTRCTVTSRAPTLSATRQLVGSASVVCTATAVVTIELTVVELDGTVEDRAVLMPNKSVTQTLTRNVAVIIPTNAATCISTEVGNEEYATRARVSLSGVVSLFDRTVPRADSFAC